MSKSAKLTNEQIIELLQSEKPINKARREFSSASASIEQSSQQRTPLSPIDMRRMEFGAVEKITNAMGLHLPSDAAQTAPDMRFIYKNWRGETRERQVRPKGFDYGSNEWHPEPQWFLVGIDTETGEERHFAMKDIKQVL